MQSTHPKLWPVLSFSNLSSHTEIPSPLLFVGKDEIVSIHLQQSFLFKVKIVSPSLNSVSSPVISPTCTSTMSMKSLRTGIYWGAWVRNRKHPFHSAYIALPSVCPLFYLPTCCCCSRHCKPIVFTHWWCNHIRISCIEVQESPVGVNVWFQKISIPPHGWSMEFPRVWGG